MSGEIDFFKGPAGKIFILGLAGLVAFTVFWRISWGSRADDAYAVRFAGDVNLSLFGGFKDAYAGPLCENRPRKKRILFLDHDDNYFPLIYEQICRGKYNDLIPVCSQFLVLKWYFVELSQRYPFLNMTLFKDELSDPKSIVKRRIRDIIMSNPELEISCLLNNEPLFPEEIKLVPCGLVFNLLKHRQELSGINRVLNFDFSGFANFEDNLSGLLIKPHLFFDPASFQALRYYALAAVNMGIFAVSEDEPFRGYEFLCHTDRLFSFLSASVQGQVFFLKGKALLLSKKYDSAAQFLSRALEFGQADEKGEIFFLRGLAFMGLKHKDHAVRDFGRAKKAGKTLLPHIIDYMGSNP
jgi:tetratricopeptide (TPR) repeat protein